MNFVFGPEIVFPLLILALALALVGFRRQGGSLFLLAVTLITFPIFKGFLLQFFPFWVSASILIIVVFVALRYILGLLLGAAADQTVGQLFADMIKGILKLPFWLWRSLQIGTHLRRTGTMVGRAGLRVVERSCVYAKSQFAAASLRNQQAPDLEIYDRQGMVAAFEGQYYYIDLGDGVTGLLPVESCAKEFQVGQSITCRIVEKFDELHVVVRLS